VSGANRDLDKPEWLDHSIFKRKFKNDQSRLTHETEITRTFEKGLDRFQMATFTIVVSWDVYYKAICLLNDDELKRLSNYTFHIVDNVEHNDNSVYLIRRRNFESPRFNMVIEDIPLDGGHRNIQRVIDGVTIYCEKCNHITYVQHLMH
jgi:hypothetical protein